MKAIAVFPAAREVRVIDVAEPHITQPTEAKLRMLEVGICGTDKEICRFEYGTPPEGSDYLIIGHESLGEVVEVGSAVDTVHVGDLVVTTVRRPCAHPECLPCRSGHQDFCTTDDFTERGIKGLHGYLAEYVVDDASYMNVVPPHLRDIAVLVEPSTIAAKALFETQKILRRLPWVDATQSHLRREKSYTALVLGGGAVGLLGAFALENVGFATYVYDRAPAPNPKSRLVESIGAHYIAEQDRSQFTHLIGRVAVVYEATGASQLAFDAMRLLGPNSIFIFTGVPALKDAKQVDIDAIMRNAVLHNQVIFGTVNAGKDAYEASIAASERMSKRWPHAMHGLISGRYPLDAYRDLLLGDVGGIKNVLSFDAVSAQQVGAVRASAQSQT